MPVHPAGTVRSPGESSVAACGRMPRLPSITRTVRRRCGSHGQSLVEFALTLPVLMLLTVVALDFGRVYLGLHQPAEHGPDRGQLRGEQPDAWGATPDADVQARYREPGPRRRHGHQLQPSDVQGKPVVPDPTFTDLTGDGSGTGLGDNGEVQLTCRFGVITPFISNILGGAVKVSAESNFPVKSGLSAVASGGSSGGGGAVAPSAAFSANLVISPSSVSGHDAVRRRVPRHVRRRPDRVGVGLRRRRPSPHTQDPLEPHVHHDRPQPRRSTCR